MAAADCEGPELEEHHRDAPHRGALVQGQLGEARAAGDEALQRVLRCVDPPERERLQRAEGERVLMLRQIELAVPKPQVAQRGGAVAAEQIAWHGAQVSPQEIRRSAVTTVPRSRTDVCVRCW